MDIVMVVEDELIIQLDIRIELEENGFKVFTADNGADALEIVRNNDVDCILMDINIKGDMNGIETAEAIQKEMDIPVIFSTANDDMLDPEKHPYVIKKPFNIKEIHEMIEKIQ